MTTVVDATDRVPWLRWIDRLSILLAVLGGVATIGLMLNVVVDVIGRYFFNQPFPGTLDLTQFAWMPTLVSLGLGYALLRGEHIRVNLLTGPTGPRTQRIIEIVGMVFTLGTAALIVWYGTEKAMEAMEFGEKAVGTPWLEIWPYRWVIAVGMAGLLLQAGAALLRAITVAEFRPVDDDEVAALQAEETVFEELEPALVTAGREGATAVEGGDPTRGSVRTAPRPPAARTPADLKAALTARRFTIGLVVAAIATILLATYIYVAPSNKLLVGFLIIFLMMALMLFKIPIGIAMTAAAVFGLYVMVGPNAVVGSLKEIVFTSFASWSLSVIPMFVLMGVAMGKSGLMAGAYDVARKWLGRLPGGLAIATNFAGAGMAATSGSTIGMTYAIGRVSIPEMIRSGYKPSLAMGAAGMAGTLGQVIPPSVLLVIYAGVAETPVGPQLLAGIVPGLALAVMFTVVIILWAALSPGSAPRGPRFAWQERLASLVHLVPMLIIVVVVLGGIYAGVFTATEAGAYGALITLILGLGLVVARSRSTIRNGESTVPTRKVVGTYFSSTLMETVSAVAAVMLLLVGVLLLTRVMALSGLAQWVADGVIDLGLSKLGFLLLLIPIYLILGFFLDTLAMMLLTIPVFMGPLVALDVDLIWFGVFLIVLAEIDLVAPPLGVLNFVVLAISQSSTKGMGLKLKITDVFKGVMPFIAACIVILVILIAWPDLALWLPGISSAE